MLTMWSAARFRILEAPAVPVRAQGAARTGTAISQQTRERLMDRREFIRMVGAGVAAAHVAPLARARGRDEPFKKAVKLGMVEVEGSLLDKFRLLKRLGFDGVELSSPNEFDTAEVVQARDEAGLPVHGVVDSVHWRKTLSDPDPEVRAEGRAGLETALRDAQAYGASTVLLVPAVVTKEVAYDEAYRRSREEIAAVLPLAREVGVRIALENVWNHFLLSPLEFAQYIDGFDSPWIGAYFDVGNVVNYGWPEHWIRILGARILKLDVKEYSREKRDAEGPYAGFRVPLGEGDCDWPAVRAALADVGYEGWATAEIPGGDEERLREIAQRMDRIL